MTKQVIQQLGATGLMIDGDDGQKPDNAFTDSLNVRFNGREVAPYYGNAQQPYYTGGTADPEWQNRVFFLMSQVQFDGFSDGSMLIFGCGITKNPPEDTPDPRRIFQTNLNSGAVTEMVTPDSWTPDSTQPWTYYKESINNCPIFGQTAMAPIGKQYDWTGFDALPSWGNQTTGIDSTTDPDNPTTIVSHRRWTCKKMVSFDNRLLALNTVEESAGGQDVPYPSRVRWSGFAQENALPINWDDQAANGTPEDFAAAVIDGYAGWQDLSSNTQVIDAVANGNTLYIYTERETYSMSPSGNDEKPFITNLVYSDLGVLDTYCAVNAHSYNYVFTGSDVARHDAVSWVSIADDKLRDFIAELVEQHQLGQVRLINYPDLSEIWLMVYGTDQATGDFAKTTAYAYNYNRKTWQKKSLPYIYDAEFLRMPPESVQKRWDDNTVVWDAEPTTWNTQADKVAQGTLCGSCAAGGVYYLNTDETEWRNIYTSGTYTMTQQPVQRYVERRGLVFGEGDRRAFVSECYIQGRGQSKLAISVGAADHIDAGYTWETQNIDLQTTRRPTFRQEGGVFGYRFEINGIGDLPSALTFTYVQTGYK